MKNEKTHWLQSPNKNYLGHWDLPENKDLTLTIESAKWEEVKNPIINRSEAKRVIRFKEDIKPMICNQTNAQSIIKSTGVKFMEDSKGCRIQLYVGVYKDRISKEDADCVRVRSKPIQEDSGDLLNEGKSKVDEFTDANKLAKECRDIMNELASRGLSETDGVILSDHVNRKHESLKPDEE